MKWRKCSFLALAAFPNSIALPEWLSIPISTTLVHCESQQLVYTFVQAWLATARQNQPLERAYKVNKRHTKNAIESLNTSGLVTEGEYFDNRYDSEELTKKKESLVSWWAILWTFNSPSAPAEEFNGKVNRIEEEIFFTVFYIIHEEKGSQLFISCCRKWSTHHSEFF